MARPVREWAETNEQRSKRLTAERDARIAACPVKPTDLTKITRSPKQCRTWVQLEWDWETRIEWLEFGEASLRRKASLRRNERHDGRYNLEARFTSGVTDREHDSAFALRLPLVGVEFEWVANHLMRFFGFVDATLDPKDRHCGFHVPKPGYDPRKNDDTHECKRKECKDDKPFPHLILPEGFYVPPFDAELYELVRGKRLSIIMGPAPGKDD